MLKSTAKDVLRALTRTLPWGAKMEILNGVIDDLGRFEVFQRIARELGIENISVRGANGLIWGSIEDSWCLGNYAMMQRWEQRTVNVLEDCFSDGNGGGTFLDIGANIGLNLFPLAQNRNVECHAFEPDPLNFSFLSRGVRDNCFHNNVTLYQLALFDRKSSMILEKSDFNWGDHRIRTTEAAGDQREESRATVVVAANRLDDVLPLDQLKRPIGVKIDVQGAEPNVFAGAQKTFAASKLIAMEFAPYMMRRIGGDAEAELQFLAEHFREGFVTKAGGHGKQQRPEPSEAEPRWRPVSAIIDELRGYWADPAAGLKEWDVTFRK